MKILFFIGTLSTGGKERRLIELLSYLKTHTNFNLMVIFRRNQIEYPAFYELKIPYKILTVNYKKRDITLHFRFFKMCKEFKPDIIHTWGSMSAFVSLPAIILLKIPLINSQITDAPTLIRKWDAQFLINKINFKFSTIILSNSRAGLKAYKTGNKKSKVIYNGINLERLNNLADEQSIIFKYGVKTPFSIIMVASFSELKDYDKFMDVAKEINSIRKDITFIAVGDGINLERIKKRTSNDQTPNIIFAGKINDVENLVNVADIGILFSTNGEGISNAIIEYMALAKPVIANDAGGTREIVRNRINGYLINDESALEIASIINKLLNDKDKRQEMGNAGRQLIYDSFTIERMGEKFERVYESVMSNTQE